MLASTIRHGDRSALKIDYAVNTTAHFDSMTNQQGIAKIMLGEKTCKKLHMRAS